MENVSDNSGGYLYDADGTRVAKGSITTWSCDPGANGLQITNDYVLGLGGEQVAELGMGGAAKGSSTTGLTWQHTNVWAGGKLLGTYDKDGLHFYLDDPLGTRRAQTDYAGVLEQTCSSLPYGDQLACTSSTIAPSEHHFTGKERDAESGNDYFNARYYGSSMGRFLSPDPLPWIHWQNGNEDDQKKFASYIANPQNFNMYAYVLNNPLNKTDPTGMNACGTNNDSTCHVTISFNSRTKDANGHYNDQYKGLKGQAGYNAIATVTVTGTRADGKAFNATATFLAKTTPDSPASGAPLANGTYIGSEAPGTVRGVPKKRSVYYSPEGFHVLPQVS